MSKKISIVQVKSYDVKQEAKSAWKHMDEQKRKASKGLHNSIQSTMNLSSTLKRAGREARLSNSNFRTEYVDGEASFHHNRGSMHVVGKKVSDVDDIFPKQKYFNSLSAILAVKENDLDLLKAILSVDPRLATRSNYDRSPSKKPTNALVTAIQTRNMQAMEMMLKMAEPQIELEVAKVFDVRDQS